MDPSSIFSAPTAPAAPPQPQVEEFKPIFGSGGSEGQGGDSWASNLLPTIGGIALPLLGAALAPVTGGSSLLLAAGLSAAGTAGGKLAENAVEGNSLDKDLMMAGAEGLIGGGVGGLVGKGLAKGAQAMSGHASKVATNQAQTQAAEDAIESVANTYKDISPQLQKAYNAKDSLAHVRAMGYDVADPENLKMVANTSNDILNETLNRALNNAGPVNMGNYNQMVKEALTEHAGILGSFDKVALSRGRLGHANTPAAKLLQQLQDLGAGVAKENADPNEIRTLTTKLFDLAQDAKPGVAAATGAKDPVQVATYNVINKLRDNVKAGLYSRKEVNDALAGEIGNLVPSGNLTPELAEHLNKIITGAGKGSTDAAQDLLSEIARNINISKLGQEGQRVGQIVTSTGAKARAATDAGLDQPGLDSHPLLQAAGVVTPDAGLATNAVRGAMHAAQNPAVLETLSRIGKLGSKLAPAAGVAVATSPNLAAAPVDAQPGGTMGDTMDGAGQGPTTLQAGPNTYQGLLDAMRAQAILAPNLGGGASSFLTAVAPQMQQRQMAMESLQALPEGYANAGGAQGLPGILSQVTGLIPGTAANSYEKQRQAAAQQLALAMGISPEAAAGLLPQLMQNENTAGLSSGILSSLQGQLAY